MTPILIYKDTNAIDTAVNNLEASKEFFQSIVDNFNSLSLGDNKKLKNNDLSMLFANPKSFIVDKVTEGENLTIGTIQISKEKAFEILNLPTEIHTIIKNVDNARKGNTAYGFAHRNQVNNFTIDNGLVQLKTESIETIETSNSIYANTQEELQTWKLMEEIATKLNELRTITSTRGMNLRIEDIEYIFGFDRHTNSDTKNTANPKAFKRLF
ncbi:hypothetical protein BWK63_05000 [Flavobacterium covae]|uniref:hypothetical protein n=1 Tax=Flavobacterium covae TaxID=2906076 RepID=UPI000B4D6B11|nr:hypothetical protein [Flavobacterium covae]OWP81644.1 hypothetical protein BWK63_05000 [Flavobacterium covae]